MRSTGEPAEQGRATFCGGRGGKGTDEGEQRSIAHAPDTEREAHVPGIGRCAESSKGEEAYLSVELLRDSFYPLQRKASPGVDGVTWQEYETGLGDRLVDLHNRVHRGTYRAQRPRYGERNSQ